MAKRRNSAVFLDVSIDGDPAERMVFELYHDIAPNTAENFRSLCTGEKGVGPKSGKPLHYKGSFFHRIVTGSLAQGGDFVRRDGSGGESIYAQTFPADVPRIKHDAPGILSMANADRDSNGSQFLVTFKSSHHLDRKCTAFGKIVEGHKVLKKIEGVGDEEGVPSVTVKIINSGELLDDKKKVGKVKGCAKDFFDDENKNDIKKGKRKKSSSKKGRRKKRRKYSTSESDTSSDTETETSESNTDSLSSSDSSSYTSSSSDDRHKRHKKSSKRDKYRHVRKRDKRRDKKRKRHDKKSKRHSKRLLDSDTDVESVEKSGSSSDVNQNETPRRSHDKTPTAGDKPPLKGGSEVSYVNRKMEEGILLEGQKGRSPMVNGEQWSGGVGGLNNSFGVANKQLDLGNQPMKSRSRSESSRKTMSKSMSISPGRSLSRSPGVSRKQNLSRSPSRSPCDSENSGGPANPIPTRTRRERSLSRSPSPDDYSRRISGSRDKLALLQRGRSRTPVRISTRKSLSKSPPRGTARKSISRSPVKSHRSLSRSSGRPALRKSPSVSPDKPPSRSNWHGYPNNRGAAARSRIRSPPSDHGRSVSRSPSSDDSPKRIRRGRGFSERYSYARRYRTRSPEHRYGSRYERDRYSGYRRYSDRSAWGYRSPPRVRSPPRYRSRRSRSRSLSASRSPVRRRGRRFSRSRSPVEHSRYRSSPRVERRSLSRSRSRSRSSLASQSPAQEDSSMERSRSLSESPPARKSAGLVSYGDASPASAKR